MTLTYLLDTNIISEPTRPQPNASLLQKLQQHQQEIATATPVWHELLFGTFRLPPSLKRTFLENYLFSVVAPTIPILPYDMAAAQWHAEERSRLTNLGLTPSFVDGQIAAIAHTNQLILITANEKDYRSFTNLTIENWLF